MTFIIIGGSIGLLMLLCGGIGVVGMLMDRSKPDTAKSSQPSTVQQQPKKLAAMFDPAKLCNLPSESSDPLMRELAGGEWKDSVVDGESLGYGCMIGRSSQREVQLFKSGAVAQIEYAVLGDKAGSVEYVVVDYYADISSQIPNESQHRKRYQKFMAELAKAALGKAPSDGYLNKISNLTDYGPSGNAKEYEERVGNGRVVLSLVKGPSGGLVFAKTFFYPKYQIGF
jgi:hypothetical protein